MTDPDHNPSPGEPSEEKWTYQRPPDKKRGISLSSLGAAFISLISTIGYLLCFTVVPVAVYIGVDWLVYLITRNTFYREPWMQPMILLLGTFLAGVYTRMIMEENMKTLGVFILGIFGFIGFAAINYYTLNNPGSLFSHWLPTMPDIIPEVSFCIPIAGLLGMFCYKFFSLRETL